MGHSPYIDAPRAVRLIWLAANLLSHDSVNANEYQDLFGRSMYTFRSELKTVRKAGRNFQFYFYLLFSLMIVEWLTGRQ
jgi:hypothetical protein